MEDRIRRFTKQGGYAPDSPADCRIGLMPKELKEEAMKRAWTPIKK